MGTGAGGDGQGQGGEGVQEGAGDRTGLYKSRDGREGRGEEVVVVIRDGDRGRGTVAGVCAEVE